MNPLHIEVYVTQPQAEATEAEPTDTEPCETNEQEPSEVGSCQVEPSETEPTETNSMDWLCLLRAGGLGITGITVCLVFYYIM
jgi:hypothetical protein